MHPKSGGRILLEREDVDADAVRYRAALYTADAVWRAPVAVRFTDGAVEFGVWDAGAPPAWLLGFAQAFLRSEWKARRGADPAPWPARINRWRDER